jgi:RNA polymerase sigma factor (sigma-70 family)
MDKKRMSNSQAMNLFKEAESIKNDINLTAEEVERKVRAIHDRLITELDFLVHSHTMMYVKYPNYEDLVQEGYIGLMKAVRRFDYTRFPNFFVYSEQWIRHSVKRAASRFDVVYSPNRERVVYAEPAELGIEESDDSTPEDTFFSKERAEQINLVLDDFPERDREIVKRIFGLDGFKPQTLRDIGPLYDLTHERVRQIKNNVISKLRKNQRLSELG